MITGIAHACYTVSDLDVSLEFYCGRLGLRHAFDFRNDEGVRTGVYLAVGRRTFIELFQGVHEAPANRGSYKHLCLEVDDMAATVGDLRTRQVEVTDPKLGRDNSWQAWVTDPDGNRLELHGYTPESLQAPHLD